MIEFHNILVALDIADGEVTDTGRAAAVQACALARAHGATLVLAHVLDLPSSVTEPADSRQARLRGEADSVLERVAADSQLPGVSTRVLCGEPWRAVSEEALRQRADLTVIGTKQRGIAGRMLFGSTGSKLLRACPCPVWIVKARDRGTRPLILVAHDLGEVGRIALDVASALALAQEADVHILHVIEHPEEKHFLGSVPAAERAARTAAAMQALRAQSDEFRLPAPATISIRDGSAHAEILAHLQHHPVDMLVMGTVARTGLAGLLTGNTAENVLPWVQCSLVAVKPLDFVSPVQVPVGRIHRGRT